MRCLLWDFGDTLCDERFIWGSGPEWMEVYGTFDDGIGDRWCRHELDTRSFANELAARMGRTPQSIIDHMVARSTDHIEFSPFTYDFFRAHHVPQAIVTVNPDLFSEVIVPAHDLDRSCDLVVTSWEEGTVDKAELCAVALSRLPFDAAPAEALLIDNKAANVRSWEAAGGRGYHYTTDSTFRRDVESGLLAGLGS